MKKFLGVTFGGLQKKAIGLVLIVLILTAAMLAGISAYQGRQLSGIVGNTRTEQQEAISGVSKDTMHGMLENTMTTSTELRANLADNDFAEVIKDITMLQTMAEGLLANSDSFAPLEISLPDPSADGTATAYVLHEEGVDYTQSEYLGILAHMSTPMIAMHQSSDKIDGCYIGLADGTDLCVDEKARNKYDEQGNLIPFPVRERPWYTGAVEADGLYFTGLINDAYSGKLLLTCSLPVKKDGQTVGVVGLDILLPGMSDFVDASGDGGYAYVVDDRGHAILGPEEGPFQVNSTQQIDLRSSANAELSQFVQLALQGPTGLVSVSSGGVEYYMAGSPMPSVGWAVISVVEKELTQQPERTMLQEYDKINDAASASFNGGMAKTRWIILGMLGLVMILSLAAAMIATKRMTRPIEEMTRSILHGSKSDRIFEMKDCYRTNDEIEVLATAFEDLSKKTKRYIEENTRITRETARVNTELHMANQIQESMLPSIFPPFPDRKEFDLFASMDPAKEVGGDFYDFFLIDDDHLCLVIADVSGKGIPAALFMMISKVSVQSCAMLGKSAAEILTKTNEALCTNNQVEMFVTVWLGILEISTGKLTCANAGHEYPVLKKPGGGFEVIKDKHGFVIGGMQGMKYKEYTLQLEPGSKLFVYTDGVTEATDADGNLFGMQRMLEALNEDPDACPEKILDNVHGAVDDFVGPSEQFDDLTMLCLEYRGREGAEHVKELTVEAAVENVRQVTDFVDEQLESLDCPMKAQMQIDVAIDELFSNIARYAYDPETGPATVRVEVEREPLSVIITFIDHGKPFDPLSAKEPDVTASAEEREIGGLGLLLVRRTMDDVSYEYKNGQNILRIKKQI